MTPLCFPSPHLSSGGETGQTDRRFKLGKISCGRPSAESSAGAKKIAHRLLGTPGYQRVHSSSNPKPQGPDEAEMEWKVALASSADTLWPPPAIWPGKATASRPPPPMLSLPSAASLVSLSFARVALHTG